MGCGKGRLGLSKWSIVPGPGGYSFVAERYVGDEYQVKYVNAHCLACAKTEILAQFGGRVDLRGWHLYPGGCGSFLKVTQDVVMREEEDV